jgi:metal-responsive CopG/Arc/MetJ family transcriptional regulator
VLVVSIERGLLEKADAFAKRHKLKRSEMVAHGLLRLMKRPPLRRPA